MSEEIDEQYIKKLLEEGTRLEELDVDIQQYGDNYKARVWFTYEEQK